jgi:uncharacterized protein YdeI (YjbR/CyaY-like superfamily)
MSEPAGGAPDSEHSAQLQPTSAADWESWLARWHEHSGGVWLALAKRGSGLVTVSYSDALDAALCFGWIDGRKRALDDRLWLQRFTPRRPRSRWSQINRERAEALERAGRLRPAGAAQVALARRDGRWEAAYPGQRSAEVPADLAAALDANPLARANFDALDSANRYSILYRVVEAKRDSTRARRIAAFVEMLADGRTPHG